MLVGSMSRISPEKGILNLIHGFAHALTTCSNLRLVIIGSCQEEHAQYLKSVQTVIPKRSKQKVAVIPVWNVDTASVINNYKPSHQKNH